MSDKFILSCCSTVDLPYSYLESRYIPVLFYTYVVDGVTYDDDMGRDLNLLAGRSRCAPPLLIRIRTKKGHSCNRTGIALYYIKDFMGLKGDSR